MFLFYGSLGLWVVILLCLYLSIWFWFLFWFCGWVIVMNSITPGNISGILHASLRLSLPGLNIGKLFPYFLLWGLYLYLYFYLMVGVEIGVVWIGGSHDEVDA